MSVRRRLAAGQGLRLTDPIDQIAAFSDEDVEKVDTALNYKGRVTRDDWVGQAKTLAGG